VKEKNNMISGILSSNKHKMILVEEVDGEILIFTIHRPNVKNAVDRETAQELYKKFQFFENSKFKIAVLRGSEGNFCSGADLKSLSKGEGNKLEIDTNEGPMGPTRMLLSKPVIACVEGYAVAGGLELACWCDLRVVDETAVFSVSCRRFGVPLIDGGTIRLPKLIGMSRALDMILTGRSVDAKESYEIGLSNRLVPKGKSLQHSIELAKKLCQFPQECMRNDRLSVYQNFSETVISGLSNEFKLGLKTLSTKEFEEGSKKFIQKDFIKISKL
jgi:enoyl-CoA hydratase